MVTGYSLSRRRTPCTHTHTLLAYLAEAIPSPSPNPSNPNPDPNPNPTPTPTPGPTPGPGPGPDPGRGPKQVHTLVAELKEEPQSLITWGLLDSHATRSELITRHELLL